jgi:adenine-specific DNA-methyltransferase
MNTKEDIKALLVTWKTYDGIPLTQDPTEVDLGGYTAYYIEGASGNKLYLMHKGFQINHLKTLLEKTDSDRRFSPKTIIAFGYHFDSKTLRDIADNIKAYTNKKKIDMDFLVRY